MKHTRASFFRLLAVSAAWALAGCQIEQDGQLPDAEVRYLDVVVTAQQEGDETKTGVTDGGTTVSWLPGDAITVFCNGKKSELTTAINSPSTTASFTGTLPVNVPETMSSGDYVWGLYPANGSATFANGIITTTLPAVQEGKTGSFADDLMILLGRVALEPSDLNETPVDVSMTFKNVCSGVRFKVTRDDIKSVTMRAIGGENLCGTIQIGLDGGNPTVQSVTNGSSSIVLNAPNNETFTTNQWYYFITIPFTTALSQGLEFTMTTATKEGIRTVSSNGITLARKTFCQAPGLDSGITFEDAIIEVQVAGPDTWVAMDETGRSLPDHATVGDRKSDRHVLMYYWPWHCDHQVTYLIRHTGLTSPYFVNYTSVVNVTGVQWFYPEALSDPTDVHWGIGYDQLCFWGEPLFGYYRTTDPWVLRKHAEMLADAGVDAVAFDCTNGTYLWESGVDQLITTWRAARQDGVNVPKIIFMLALADDSITSGPGYQLRQNGAIALRNMYYKYYRTHDNDDMWFYLDGDDKPLVMAFPNTLNTTTEGAGGGAYDADIRARFTFRPIQGDYVNTHQSGQWGWLQSHQNWNTFNGGEEISVSVAQNARDASSGHCFAFNAPDTYGRSYTYAPRTGSLPSQSYRFGYNFQEQWDNALGKDETQSIPYIFVTGWNEWVALMQAQWPDADYPYGGGWGVDSGNAYFAFADQYDAEHSRDIEPTINWGDHGDNYYYQLAQNIRQYKGVSAYPKVTRAETMEIDGDFTGWDQVSPDFKHYPGNTMHRAHLGHTNGNIAYFNNTGRNDFVDARVTRDANFVYFYVETAEAITDYTNEKWMRLLINSDCDWTTGWKGYDYILNYISPSSPIQGYVSACQNNAWNWSRTGTFDYWVVGNKMELRVPRSLFPAGKLDFAFKWADNNLYDQVPTGREERILNLYVDGDAAPGGRFNFHYVEP